MVGCGHMKTIQVEQGTVDWLQARLGKVTGTRLKAVMGSTKVQDTLICELVAEQLTGQPEEFYTNNAMAWGKEYEDEAVVTYERLTGVRTDKVGFCVSDTYPYLGLSPDRLIKNKKGVYTKGVEVKAPTTKTFIRYMLDGGVPDEYHWQVVNYFLVCETLKELDFIVYDPRIIDESKRLIITAVTRKELAEDIAAAATALAAFHARWKEAYNQIKK